ncbi:unnamed protein product [Notodromas monacha]|uniref:Small ribosomal subunit protein eS7 n=1 Tax=Notodromas monacha TaxID=399045 RepID=A0A7R9BWQ2_9CRUS|nr:unnamed protein product [Notodromas monacha]CAG0921517.1 unnamed protein product [Notodromas monacha]
MKCFIYVDESLFTRDPVPEKPYLIGRVLTSGHKRSVFITDITAEDGRLEDGVIGTWRRKGNGDTSDAIRVSFTFFAFPLTVEYPDSELTADGRQEAWTFIRYSRKALASGVLLPVLNPTCEFVDLTRSLQKPGMLRRRHRRHFANKSLDLVVEKLNGFSSLADVVYDKVQQMVFCYTTLRSGSWLAFWNTALLLSVDLILGFLLTTLVVSFTAKEIMGFFQNSTDVIVDKLDHLLDWLMGVPVGLKLNQETNYALGLFFKFHMYLWKTYMALITPLALEILEVVLLLGKFGLSLQLSILRDMVCLAAFHVYCFYVYAARLYSFCIKSLECFGRLFRGKKWNPLRKRVDSASDDDDRYYVGIGVFTITLFILPAFLVYYVVFTLLRLLFLSLDAVFSLMIKALNSFPVSSFILWFWDSSLIHGCYKVEQGDGNPSKKRMNLLTLKSGRSSLWATVNATAAVKSKRMEQTGLKSGLRATATCVASHLRKSVKLLVAMVVSAESKIKKPNGENPDELETSIAQALVELESSTDVKAQLRELQISSVKELECPQRKSLVIFVPYPQLKAYQKIHTRLVRELEKKFSGKHVVFIAQRRILPKPTRKMSLKSKQKRPRSRTLTAVHEAILDDLVYPAEIVGKRIRTKLDGSRLIKVHLDKSQQTTVEHKVDTFKAVYKRLTGKNVEFEFPERIF